MEPYSKITEIVVETSLFSLRSTFIPFSNSLVPSKVPIPPLARVAKPATPGKPITVRLIMVAITSGTILTSPKISFALAFSSFFSSFFISPAIFSVFWVGTSSIFSFFSFFLSILILILPPLTLILFQIFSFCKITLTINYFLS